MHNFFLVWTLFIGISTNSVALTQIDYSDKFEIDVQFGTYNPNRDIYWQFSEYGSVPVSLKNVSLKLLKSPSDQLTHSYYDYMNSVDSCHKIEPDAACLEQEVIYSTEILPDTQYASQHLSALLSESIEEDNTAITMDYKFTTDTLPSGTNAKNDYLFITTYEFEANLSNLDFYLNHETGTSSYNSDSDATLVRIENIASTISDSSDEPEVITYHSINYDHNLFDTSLNKKCYWALSDTGASKPSQSMCVEPSNRLSITIGRLEDSPAYLDGPIRNFKLSIIHSALEVNKALNGIDKKEGSAGSNFYLLLLLPLLLLRRSARHG